MPVTQLPPQATTATATGEVNIWEAFLSIAPYAVGIAIILLVIVIIFIMWKKKPIKPDYNKEAYKKLYKQLLGLRLNKGMGSIFFTATFLFLGLGLGLLVFGDATYFIIASGLMMLFTSRVIISGFSHKFESENYIYDKDFNQFAVIESLPLYTGDGIKYILIRQGKKGLFLQHYEILAMPSQSKYKFTYLDAVGKAKIKTGDIKNFDKLSVKNDKGDLMINSKGFDLHNNYYFPTIELKDKTGRSMFSFREIAFNVNKNLTNELMIYDLQTENQRNIIASVNTNPMVRLYNKTKDLDVDDTQEKPPAP